jgi:hypothetical protein
MKLSTRLNAFCQLGARLQGLTTGERQGLAEKARNENPWFVAESVLLALKGIEVILDKEKLTSWALSYGTEPSHPKTVGVAMAGNIPLVGFHDFLCVLISGHRIKAKLSANDTALFTSLIPMLLEIEPEFQDRITLAENLKEVDAIIATGSDNTSRYFEYYFRKIPHLIRKNRASCGVILGEEPAIEFELLGKDVFSYFGLGCRNVSKLYVPHDFDLGQLIQSWRKYEGCIDHHKYANNYDYKKSILLLNREPFYDGGFVLLKESAHFVSPIATVFFEFYKTQEEVKQKINLYASKLQVITAAQGWFAGSKPFGDAQLPQVGDYADNIDTMNFLAGVK